MRLTNVFVLVSLLSLYACGASSPPVPQLRVTNIGEEAIDDLTVLFPDSELKFGDIPAGATTEYKVVPGGVYGYAAYRFKVGGRLVTQPVIDFVGASPLGRARFSYRLELVSSPTAGMVINLVEVTNDG